MAKQTKARFKTLFEASADGILIADIKTRKFIYANPAVCKLLGYSLNELRKMGIMEIHPKGSLPHVVSEFEMQAKGKKSLAQNIPCLRKNKTVFYADINTTKEIIDGRLCNIGFFRDVTGRKKTEDALKESEEKIKQIFASSPDSITVTDLKGKITECNQETLKLHRCASKKEIIGRSAFELIAEKDRKKAVTNLKKTFKEGNLKNAEYTLVTKDGKQFAAELSASLIKDASGTPVAFVAITKDITERKKAEKEKEKLQKKLKQYAKKLELKLKTYEKSKIKLTDREKKVFCGLARHPAASDEELSKKIGVKRSTVTAIKNKLKKQNLFTRAYIPNMQALGCELMTFIHMKFSMPHSKRQGILKPHFKSKVTPAPAVFIHTTDDEIICMAVSKNLVEFQKKYDLLQNLFIQKKIRKGRPFILHVPFGASQTNLFFDFSYFLNDFFELDFKKNSKKDSKNPARNLRKNEKIILYAMIKYPQLSNAELARKTRLTQITVARIRRNLIEEGFAAPAVIPNVKKIGCELLVMETAVRSKKDPAAFIEVKQANQTVAMKICKGPCENTGENTYKCRIQKAKQIQIDFAHIVKEVLELKEEI